MMIAFEIFVRLLPHLQSSQLELQLEDLSNTKMTAISFSRTHGSHLMIS